MDDGAIVPFLIHKRMRVSETAAYFRCDCERNVDGHFLAVLLHVLAEQFEIPAAQIFELDERSLAHETKIDDLPDVAVKKLRRERCLGREELLELRLAGELGQNGLYDHLLFEAARAFTLAAIHRRHAAPPKAFGEKVRSEPFAHLMHARL